MNFESAYLMMERGHETYCNGKTYKLFNDSLRYYLEAMDLWQPVYFDNEFYEAIKSKEWRL